jgi:predicted TIM-barrel fold metal-dependent hydrolase
MRAIDVHVHPSTSEYVHDALGPFGPACEAYFRTTLPSHDVDQMAAVFRDADVLGVLFAWDAETNTGLPPVTNDFVAGCVRAHPEAFLGFASVDPHKGVAAKTELERAVRDLGLRGLKLHPTAQGFRPDDRSCIRSSRLPALGIPVTCTVRPGLGADAGRRECT